jgi:hypothetical protein
MEYDLISAEEAENLPDDDEERFVAWETMCARNMTKILKDESHGEFFAMIRGRYMAAVYAAGLESGITDLPDPTAASEHAAYDFYNEFCQAVQGAIARIRFRNRRSRNSLSVQLTENTRAKIRHYLSRLREAIEQLDLPAWQKQAAFTKLDEFEEELGKRRLSYGKVMAILVALASATTIAADGPSAITHIMSLISIDKESEDAAASRLAPPPKALAAPPAKPPAAPTWTAPKGDSWQIAGELDDEIPF